VVEITDQAGLDAVRTGLSGKYILLNNIELNESIIGFDGAAGWQPIGNSSSQFSGIFNGGNHKITNLWIARTVDYTGLFGHTNNAKISNLGVEASDKNISGRQYVGGIVGYVSDGGSITNSYVIGDINGTEYVGGIVGWSYYNDCIISNSRSAGNITGTAHVGGIAGRISGSGSTIKNSYASGSVSGSSENVGGIAGSIDNGTLITNNYTNSVVSGGNNVGGIVGLIEVAASTIQNNAAVGSAVSGSSNVNRIVGFRDNGTVKNNFAYEDMLVPPPNAIGASGFVGTNKSAAALTRRATYENSPINEGLGGLGWYFGNSNSAPWQISEGVSYPYLYWENR
jgi:hypothetical protein